MKYTHYCLLGLAVAANAGWVCAKAIYKTDTDFGHSAWSVDWRSCLSLTLVAVSLWVSYKVTNRLKPVLLSVGAGSLTALVIFTRILMNSARGYYEPGNGFRPLEYAALASFVAICVLGTYLLIAKQGSLSERISALYLALTMLCICSLSPFIVTSEYEHPAGSHYRGYAIIFMVLNVLVSTCMLIKQSIQFLRIGRARN
jgi:hypothetical protein